MILACDVGGTKCNFALFRVEGAFLRPVFQQRLNSRDFACFGGAVRHFLAEAAPQGMPVAATELSAAGFATPGVLMEQRARSVNMPWPVDGPALRDSLGIERVVVLNDLTAVARSLPKLSEEALLPLNVGTPQPGGAKAIVAAGTGLGEAFLVWDGSRYRVAPSEGGQADFAPTTDREMNLLLSLRHRMSRVIWEEILSGRGFRVIHEFLDPALVHASFDDATTDPAVEITQRALAKSCPVCIETLDLWVAVYGAKARNLALHVWANGGVFVAGGIAIRILAKMTDGTFLRAFCDHAGLAQVLAQFPVHVVLNEDAPLLGAAYEALAALEGSQTQSEGSCAVL